MMGHPLPAQPLEPRNVEEAAQSSKPISVLYPEQLALAFLKQCSPERHTDIFNKAVNRGNSHPVNKIVQAVPIAEESLQLALDRVDSEANPKLTEVLTKALKTAQDGQSPQLVKPQSYNDDPSIVASIETSLGLHPG